MISQWPQWSGVTRARAPRRTRAVRVLPSSSLSLSLPSPSAERQLVHHYDDKPEGERNIMRHLPSPSAERIRLGLASCCNAPGCASCARAYRHPLFYLMTRIIFMLSFCRP